MSIKENVKRRCTRTLQKIQNDAISEQGQHARSHRIASCD